MPFIRTSDWTVESIKDLIEQGKTLVEIAELYGLTRQRIKQICQRHGLPNSVEVRKKLRTEKYFAKWGDKRDDDLYHACRAKFRGKKANAKAQGVEWTVAFGELEWPSHCPILGLELDYFAEERQENSPSFDRINSSQGYVAGNVKVVSWRANRIKNDGSSQEHRLIADYLDTLAEGQRPVAGS